jgi:hypothetical protein
MKWLYVGRIIYIFFGINDLIGLIMTIIFGNQFAKWGLNELHYLMIFSVCLITMILFGLIIEVRLRERK